MSRLATLNQGGKTLTYSRLTNSDRLDKAEFSPASAAPAVEYSYDTKLRLISKGCGTRSFTDKDEVWYFDCPAGTPGNWGTSRYYFYDALGQLSRAGDGALGPDGELNNPQNFSYDSIGNHLTNNETYNILNQGSGKTYDANGNMTRNGDDWIALYDGENRLRTVSHPYDGVELLYDYAGRIYQVNDFYMDGVDLPTSTLNYRRIYDGTKLIATVRNGEIEDTFVWQPETSGDADVILWDNSYVYATDPNKNVRVKRFPDEWMGSGWIEEFFDYKPFGELKNYVADPPRFMFSSEEYMPETGMYHYLYRAYSPSLARFITRDPIEEQGGVNLYCFVNNNPVSKWDRWGLSEPEKIEIHKLPKCHKEDSCEELLTKMIALEKAITERVRIMDEFRKKGQHWRNYNGHALQVRQRDIQYNDCMLLYIVHEPPCCVPPPQLQDPFPLPKWTPASYPESFQDKKESVEEASRWITWGVILYAVISIGSRFFFPPRNFIPIP